MNVFPAKLSFHSWRNCRCYIVYDNSTLRTITLLQPPNGFLIGVFNICGYSKVCEPLVVHLYSFTSSSVAEFRNRHFSTVLLNEKFASAAGFNEHDEVILEEVEEAPRCIHVEVKPHSLSDWEIVQNSAMEFEWTILNQIGIICERMTFPIWIDGNIFCTFIVVNISPSSRNGCARLVEDTEIHVRPYSEQIKENTELSQRRVEHDSSMSGLSSTFSRFFSRFVSFDNRNDYSMIDDFIKNISKGTGDMNLRIAPRSLLDDDICSNMHPSAIIALSDEGTGCCNYSSIVRIEGDDGDESIFALLLLLPKDAPNERRIADILRLRKSHCIVSPCFNNFLLADCTWIKCINMDASEIVVVKQLEVLVPQGFDEGLIPELKAYFSIRCSHYPVVMSTNGISVSLRSTAQTMVECQVRPSKTELPSDGCTTRELCFAFTCDRFPQFEVLVKDDAVDDESAESKEVNTGSSAREKVENYGESAIDSVALKFQSHHIAACTRYIEYCLESGAKPPGHVLIVGAELSGKSTIACRLAGRLLKSPRTVFSIAVECKHWKGKSTENVEKQLTSVIEHLRRRAPSVLFLENIDFSSNRIDEDQRNLHLERLFAVLWRIVTRSGVLVVATAKNLHSIHKTLAAPQGKRFFARIEEIGALEEADRLEALDSFCGNGTLKCCDLRSAAIATENFVIGDLKKLSKRIILEAAGRGAKCIEKEDIEQGLKCSRPIAQRAEKYADNMKLRWADVGGMEEVKKLLTEVFIWPTKYPSLFRSCAVRPGRGVMLHGPSGTGKTLIAKTLASECHFNVITIKGPQLLSKYIGQSEENVRTTFERARASKPCLVFFDEFDSLGAKRGHDSTGVTDRVVNQLLTELDGIEALEGVFVLGATNRIDLVDDALLRPGRFDYIIECKLPNLEERLSILKVLCRDVRLDRDVDLEYFAEKTCGYSGADLKGLVTTSQFHAIRSANLISKGNSKRDEGPLIRREDFDVTFAESSGKTKQKNKEHRIIRCETGQRVTLA
uniref:Peroxisomal ATPase PEX1 n=2 Tax=Parascaris univalens TaxID=6257 RepID=A0A914ZEY7_PARUN